MVDKKKKDKKKVLPNKWPAQEKTVPIASPPKGMWYDPKVKESKSVGHNKPYRPSLNDAIKFYIENPDRYGTPAAFDLKKRVIQFSTGKNYPFEEIIENYMKDSGKYKEGDFSDQWGDKGFFDSPKDLGKDPSGDFPSVQWMPRGTEDMDVDEDVVTAKKAEKEDAPKLTNKMMTDMVPMLMEGKEGEPDNHNCAACNMRYKDKDGIERCTLVDGKISYERGTCNFMAPGEEAKEEDSVGTKLSPDTAGYVELPEGVDKVQCATCKYYDSKNEFCKTFEGHIKPEGCCAAWDRDDVIAPSGKKASLGLSAFDKVSEEDYLSQDQKDQIAAKYGSEYISALNHYFDALADGHPADRAQEYAIAEMQKVDQTILPGTLSEISEIYMSGT